ncbi:alpha-N-acetylgalactosamine-specific lectin-like [Acanthaster planci]|uniref:Alpha-N-acetylgalactosamine-specific lectin-like n=1 Tax=Acanthaster planci TaxID=133434 RepID=A0A8B7Z594_ACAPL|nr:alpha-N-acetylgalactosamine-specific lectin-like [Acanthaster planci]
MGFLRVVSVVFLTSLTVTFAQKFLEIHCQHCPPLWTLYDSHCFRFFGTPKTFAEADKHCQQFFTHVGQGHLVSITNVAEDNLMYNMWQSTCGTAFDTVYMGLTDRQEEGNFVWLDGSGLSYTNWKDGEPNNTNRDESCAGLLSGPSSQYWEVVPCSREYVFICKMPTIHY